VNSALVKEIRTFRNLQRSGGGPGGACPECGGPREPGGRGRPPLITICDAVTGEFRSARRGGEEITEEELRQIKEQDCSLCDSEARLEINIGGGEAQQHPTTSNTPKR
jgi:hypothetical protein